MYYFNELDFFPLMTMGIFASLLFSNHEEMLNTATARVMLMREDMSLTSANKLVRVSLFLLLSRHARLHDLGSCTTGQQDSAIGQ